MSSALFYFLYFAAFGIYTPYWTLYLQHLQFSPLQIAIVYSVPSMARILFLAAHGYMADRWKSRKKFLSLSSAAQILPLILIIWFHSYPWILVLIAIYSIFNASVLPFTEAIVQEEQEKGNLDYGRTRLWGTLSFVLLALAYGKLLDSVGKEWILYGVLFFLILLAALSLMMPPGKEKIGIPDNFLHRAFASRNTWVFLSCAFLMQVSHGTFYGFYSIHLANLGYKDSYIGLQWAIAAASELSIFFFASWILKRLPQHFLFSLCLLAAVLRWILTGTSLSFAALSAYQCLHAFTFGAFHITCMRMIHTIFPEGSRSFGQAIYGTVSTGFGSMTGILLSGYLWKSLGSKSFFVSAGTALIAFGLSFLMQTERQGEKPKHEVER